MPGASRSSARAAPRPALPTGFAGEEPRPALPTGGDPRPGFATGRDPRPAALNPGHAPPGRPTAREVGAPPGLWDPERNPPAMSRAVLARPMAPPEMPPAFAYLDEPPEPLRARRTRRHRRVLTAFGYLLLAGLVLVAGHFVRAADRPAAPGEPAARPSAPPSARASARTVATAAGTSGKFAMVTGYGPILGGSGEIRRFRVAVEQPVGDGVAADFAHQVDRTLGDRRSWIAGRRFRLQRVPISAHAEFTIFLASARTSERMCRTGGLETAAYTSCRLPTQVIINDDRWRGSVRGYGAPLASYRQYVINHEVGHQLGHGHEACPGKGRAAPVMMQQTYGLKGCTANSWPYPDGRRYAGPPAP